MKTPVSGASIQGKSGNLIVIYYMQVILRIQMGHPGNWPNHAHNKPPNTCNFPCVNNNVAFGLKLLTEHGLETRQGTVCAEK